MTALAVREDLSLRTDLSKSQLAVLDICGQKAWMEIHHRRPFIPNPDTVFGSCVDAAIEQVLTAARAGVPYDVARPMDAAAELMEREGIEIHLDEVANAVALFVRDVLPAHDWALCTLQRRLHDTIEGWGECDGHPDILLNSGAIWDIKTSKRRKETARSVELGFYALLAESEMGQPVPEVGYLTWVRTKKPYWQTLSNPVTDEFRDWARERVDAYVRARNADVLLNRVAPTPINWTFPSGPKNGSLCRTCQYNPVMGGECRMAVTDGVDDDD